MCVHARTSACTKCVCACVCVCVSERERERESVCVCVCVCYLTVVKQAYTEGQVQDEQDA